MTATFNESTQLYTLDESLPRFKRFVGGIGWGRSDRPDDFGRNWSVIIGEQEDGDFMAFSECKGSLSALAKQITDLKDQFLCLLWYGDAAEIHNEKILFLRKHEGLTHYKKEKMLTGPDRYVTPSETWKHFRPERPLACIAGVIDVVKVDIEAGYQKLCEMVSNQRLGFHSSCTQLPRLCRYSFVQKKRTDETLEHPLVVAAVYASAMLLRSQGRRTQQTADTDTWYGNLQR